MVDESLARNVLDKLAGIDKQLNELYSAVDASKQLKQKLADCHSKAEAEYKQLLQSYDEAFTKSGKKLEELSNTYRDALGQIESEKITLSQQITELCQQKIELSNTVQSIIKSHAEAQERVNHALTLLQTQQTDLMELEQKLNQAFAGLDGDIASKLATYETKLSEGVIDLQVKNDAVLDEQIKKSNNLFDDVQNRLISSINNALFDAETKISELDQRIIHSIEQLDITETELKSSIATLGNNLKDELSNFINKKQGQFESFQIELRNLFGEHTQSNKQDITEIKSQLTTSLSKAVTATEELISRRLDKIEQEQTRFIERQTALINNNTMLIDQFQRSFTESVTAINRNVGNLQTEVEEIINNQNQTREYIEQFHQTIEDQEIRLKKLEKGRWPW